VFVGSGRKENEKENIYRVDTFLFFRDIFIGWIGFPGPEAECSLAFS